MAVEVLVLKEAAARAEPAVVAAIGDRTVQRVVVVPGRLVNVVV